LRATRLDPDWGDHWARWYAFEVALEEPDETAEARQERIQVVREKCKLAEPRHGDIWPRVAKDVKTHGASIEKILELAAAELDP
jgi:pre-mRNA-processing factor 6